MKKDRDLYFENQGYFGNPMMGQPGFQTSQMYANNNFGQMPPYMNTMGMNMPGGMPNYHNQNSYPNYDMNSIEQRVLRLERQIRRLDSRVNRIEAKLNLDNPDYKTTADNYQINENNMYMM